MNAERWKWRSSSNLRTASSPSPSPSPSLSPLISHQHDALSKEQSDIPETKKPRVLSKALRSVSNSSLDSMNGLSSRNTGSIRRLQKTHSSGSGSMIERFQRRVSKDSAAGSPPCDRPASPMEQLQSFSSMDIIQYGPLKVDVSLLKARSEYLVLSDQCLVKFSNAEGARNVFPQLTQTDGHGRVAAPSPAASSKSTSSDIRFEVPLRSIVAVFAEESSSSRFGIEIWWFSQWPRLAYCKAHLFFALSSERDAWLSSIQRTCKAKLRRSPAHCPVPENIKTRINHIVRATESTVDGTSPNLIFPTAKRASGAASAEEMQDQTDVSSFYLVIGPCMCYFIEALKADYSTAPGDLRLKVVSFGTVTLTRFRASVASHEQRFVLSFRLPFDRETRLDLASTHYRRVIEALTKVDRILKPMWPQQLQHVIFDIKGLPPPLQLTSGNDLGGVERSLQAYCAAFHVQVPEWRIEWNTPSQPAFRLLPPSGSDYLPLQLLAVFRALRYNSFFKGISFRDVNLSPLAGKNDLSQYGDSLVYSSLNGLRLTEDHCEFLSQAPILEQEIHALMFASASIRSIDVSNVLDAQTKMPRLGRTQFDQTSTRKMSSEILRPILMLFRRQLCHCYNISLSNNPLAPSDVDELANVLVLDHLHFRKLELANCGLGDAGLSKLWVGLAGQADSLKWIDTSSNQGTVSFDIIRHTLSQLPGLTAVKIAGNTRIDSEDSLFDEETMSSWVLEELDLSGIMLNENTIYDLANYLESPQSGNMRVIYLNNCGLTGQQIAMLFCQMGHGRHLTVHINGNRLDEGIEDLCGAVASGFAPWGLFMQMIEFNYEANYIKLLRALTVNKTIECLSLAGSSTPDAASNSACQTVSEFFSKNDTIRYLDISGFASKLDEGRLGREFSRSLIGIRENTRIEHLRVRSQMLNLNIGDLAEALADNKILHTVDCEGNDFNLSNFRHLVKHLQSNLTIRYFSAFSDQELARTIHKSVATAASSVSTRRVSVMHRFRHDKSANGGEKPLTQDLKDEWNASVASLQQILERNQQLWREREGTEETGSRRQSKEADLESIFSTAFGGLALREYEYRRSMRSSSTMALAPKRSTEASRTSLSREIRGDSEARPISTVSSDLALSPMTDEASTGSTGAPTPPEVDDMTQKELQLGEAQSPIMVYDDPQDDNYTYADEQDADGGLQMKLYRRFWNDSANRIDEEGDMSEGIEAEQGAH